MRRGRRVLALAGLAACSAACTDVGPGTAVNEQAGSSVKTEQEGIVNGDLSVDADNAVVDVIGPQNGCTGSLIAPNVVLTALHCVTDFNTDTRFTCASDGSLQSASPGSGQFGALLDPSAIKIGVGVVPDFVAHGKTIFSTNSPNVCKNDLAVLVLDQDVDIGSAPFVALRFGTMTQKGELTRVIGYGDTVFEAGAPGRRARDQLSVLAVGELSPSMPGDANTVPHTIVVGEGPCKGDSGGPLLSDVTGAQIGVYSLLLSQTCVGPDVRNTYTQVAPFESLIRQALTAAGHEPLLEPEPVTGSGGEGGAPGQGGEANTIAEGGAPTSNGGAPDASGGFVASGATAGSGGSGGVPASAGIGQGASAADDTQDQGSGSRRDPSCTCRTARRANAPLSGLLAVLGAGLALARRRRRP